MVSLQERLAQHLEYGQHGEITRVFDASENTLSTDDLALEAAFAGRSWDAHAGLYYNAARWYDPRQGRFLSEDPIGLAADTNLYRYAAGDPVNLADPTGLAPAGHPLTNLPFSSPAATGSAAGGFGGNTVLGSSFNPASGFLDNGFNQSAFSVVDTLTPSIPSSSSLSFGGIEQAFQVGSQLDVQSSLGGATSQLVTLGSTTRQVTFFDDHTDRSLSLRDVSVSDLNGVPTFESINTFTTFGSDQVVDAFTNQAKTNNIRFLPAIAPEPSTQELLLSAVPGPTGQIAGAVGKTAISTAKRVAPKLTEATGRVLNRRVAGLDFVDNIRHAIGQAAATVERKLSLRQNAPVRATRGLADEIANVGPPRSRQTISLIETRQGQTIVSGGSTDLSAAQKALARQRGLLVADDLPGFHAEVTGVATAGRRGLTPTRGVTNNRVCRDGANSCASQLGNLADEGGFGFRLSPDGRSFEFIPPSGGR